MKESTRKRYFMGMDVHSQQIDGAVADGGRPGNSGKHVRPRGDAPQRSRLSANRGEEQFAKPFRETPPLPVVQTSALSVVAR